MRVRTWSACVVLAWGIPLIVLAAGPIGSCRPAQANIRIASSTSTTSSTTTTTLVTLASSVTTAPAPSYVVQPGDTLSGIAAALGVRGGWPALYAANRPEVGPDPGLISPGTVLTVPGPAAPARYTVAAGDTLAGIASALRTAGGWPALYAANRGIIGANPNALRVGTVLAIPHRTLPRPLPPAAGQAPSGSPAPRPASAAANGHHRTAQASRPGVAGLPRWLEIVLAAAGLLIGTAFLTEPTLAIARRRRAARPGGAGGRIVLADYDRLVVTHCDTDGTICVLRPPGADPEAILLAARLVLAQDRYEELAGRLGLPAHWPRE